MDKETDKIPIQAELDETTLRLESPQALPGTLESLAGFTSIEPQKDSLERFRYLLTGGLAVETITGVPRHHHDVDLVIFDYRNQWWLKHKTDNVIAQKYWADMSFDPAYLEETAWEATYEVCGQQHEVHTVHPAIIAVQKLSDSWGRLPRERDIKDATELIKYRIVEQDDDPSWNTIAQKAFFSRPRFDFLTDRDPFHRLVMLTMQIRESLGPDYALAFRERAEKAHPHLSMGRGSNSLFG